MFRYHLPPSSWLYHCEACACQPDLSQIGLGGEESAVEQKVAPSLSRVAFVALLRRQRTYEDSQTHGNLAECGEGGYEFEHEFPLVNLRKADHSVGPVRSPEHRTGGHTGDLTKKVHDAKWVKGGVDVMTQS